MKPLSQQLAQLSVQAKKAEDSVASAQIEVKTRLQDKRDQVRKETQQALEIVNQRFNQAKSETQSRFTAMRTKVDSDLNELNRRAQESKQKFEAWQSGHYADDKETEARVAIDYAIAATKLAELATLDALDARGRAEIKSEQVQPVTA